MSKRTTMTNLSSELRPMLDRIAYDALRETNPALADAISDLLAAGQTPTQIEAYVNRHYGQRLTTQAVRGAAEYLKDK